MKALDVGGAARHQRRADELRELHDGEFFRVVAQRARLVEDLRAVALGLLQQVRGVEIFAVKRRVFAHQHRAKVFQRHGARAGFGKPVHGVAGQRDVAHIGHHGRATLPHQVLLQAGADGVAALLRLAHHGKRGVLVNLEGRQRIGNKKNVHGFFNGPWAWVVGADPGTGMRRCWPYCCTNSATPPAATPQKAEPAPAITASSYINNSAQQGQHASQQRRSNRHRNAVHDFFKPATAKADSLRSLKNYMAGFWQALRGCTLGGLGLPVAW